MKKIWYILRFLIMSHCHFDVMAHSDCEHRELTVSTVRTVRDCEQTVSTVSRL